ncbi:MAG TPA: alpha/beta hydrolase [Ardenticatenaceae bacterium]|jgi:pimeloyl-ACP methyl ester carboxylesterase
MNAQDFAGVNQRYPRLEELVPGYWEQGTVLANGIRQHYTRTGGEKPALVLLHGFAMDGLTWTRLAKRLEGEYDVIMPDARGHAQSEGGLRDVAAETLAEDVAALIGMLKLKRSFVLGHSMGASTAAHLAVAHPEVARAIALEDPPLRPMDSAVMENEGYKAWQAQWLEYMPGLKRQTPEERIAAALAQMPMAASYPEEEFVPWVEAQARLDLEMLPYFQDTSGVVPMREMIPQVRCPQLLMLAQPPQMAAYRGVNGDVSGQGNPDLEAVTSQWRDGELVIFEETGHLIHWERFERFVEVVRGFLGKH